MTDPAASRAYDVGHYRWTGKGWRWWVNVCHCGWTRLNLDDGGWRGAGLASGL